MRKTIFMTVCIVSVSIAFSGCGLDKQTQNGSFPSAVSTAVNTERQEASPTPVSSIVSQDTQATPAATISTQTKDNGDLEKHDNKLPESNATQKAVVKTTPGNVKLSKPSNRPTGSPENRPKASMHKGQQGNFNRPDITGQVASISGSTLVINLMEQTQRNKDSGKRQQSPSGTPQPKRDNPTFTGETKTVTIPAGMSITTVLRPEEAKESKNIELKDIKVGDMIQVWYSDKEKGTISRVSISSFKKN
jgi:hypothetical protein